MSQKKDRGAFLEEQLKKINNTVMDSTIIDSGGKVKPENQAEKITARVEESDAFDDGKNEKSFTQDRNILESLKLKQNYFKKGEPKKWIYIHEYIKNDKGEVIKVVFSQSGKDDRKKITFSAEKFISIINGYDLGEKIKSSPKNIEDIKDGSTLNNTTPKESKKEKIERKAVEFSLKESLDVEGYVAFAKSYLEDADNWYTEENDFDKEDIPALVKRAKKRLWEKEIYAKMIEDGRIREEVVPEAIKEVKKRLEKAIRHEAEAENTLTEEIPDNLNKALKN